ncbi:MAG: Bax inhibitor-1 family protein [Gemmataceae bacterium]
MNYDLDQSYGLPAAASPASARAAFIKRTYVHLLAAVLAFVGLEALLIALVNTGAGENLLRGVIVNRGAWLAVLVLFMVGGYAARYMARSHQSVGLQYAGLALYVMLEAVLFLPLMYFATSVNINLPLQAGIVTLAVFGGLTVSVFLSGKDFSFMGPILSVVSMVALGVIIASMLFGFSLGLLFCAAMVAFAAGAIIYSTSNVMHVYGTNEHVAASLDLFSAVALLFWYVLQIFMISRND